MVKAIMCDAYYLLVLPPSQGCPASTVCAKCEWTQHGKAKWNYEVARGAQGCCAYTEVAPWPAVATPKYMHDWAQVIPLGIPSPYIPIIV